MPAVLFVCTGNRYRSPIAAATFRSLINSTPMATRWEVSSAGTWTTPGLPAVPSAIAAARALGLDITDHISCLINTENLGHYDLVLVMETGHKEAIAYEFPLISDRIFLLSAGVS